MMMERKKYIFILLESFVSRCCLMFFVLEYIISISYMKQKNILEKEKNFAFAPCIDSLHSIRCLRYASTTAYALREPPAKSLSLLPINISLMKAIAYRASDFLIQSCHPKYFEYQNQNQKSLLSVFWFFLHMFRYVVEFEYCLYNFL